MKSLKVLFSTHSAPNYIPPLTLSSHQIIIGPKYPTTHDAFGRVVSLNCPRQFDVDHLVQLLPASERPDLFVALVDSSMQCVPRNLMSLKCRKVLVIADTHHGSAPISQLLQYCRTEAYDRIAVTHDPHHLHWFAEAGLQPVSLHLNLNVHDHAVPFQTVRRPYIQFIGQVGPSHPRRFDLLNQMVQAGLPVMQASAAANFAAVQFSKAQLSFNCSLNGDFNMRVFEVLAAGGCLLTDRLSAESGLESFFQDGRDLIIYDSAGDLIEKARYYLNNPALCLQIAQNGHQRYKEMASERLRRQRFLEFAMGDEALALSLAQQDQSRDIRCSRRDRSAVFEQRLSAYELLQELQRIQLIDSVMLSPAIPRACADDIGDLVHLRVEKNALSGVRVCGVFTEKDLVSHLDACAVAPLGFLLIVGADDHLLERQTALKRLGYQVLVQMKAGDQFTWLLQAS